MAARLIADMRKRLGPIRHDSRPIGMMTVNCAGIGEG